MAIWPDLTEHTGKTRGAIRDKLGAFNGAKAGHLFIAFAGVKQLVYT
jgi:hypothetical protein